MAKSKTVYVCQNCGAESAKWIGKCNACHQWNTFVEEIIAPVATRNISYTSDPKKSKPVNLTEIETVKYSRIKSGVSEFDRILGGGIVPGTLILLGGDPGIGKSTLALQIATQLNQIVLYVSGEESLEQIKLRSNRLTGDNGNCLVYNEVQLEQILEQIKQRQPKLVIIDSIQTIFSNDIESGPGSVSQIRECAARLLRYANQSSVSFIIIGHITKEGNLAGPKVLEHVVDTVLQFEGDRHLTYRMLRSIKNRFGSVPELAIFEMTENGLDEIKDASGIFLTSDSTRQSGLSISCTMDGIKPFLTEIQALVGSAVYGTPQRTCTGFDVRRLNMLLAVLERHARLNLSNKDVFLNIAGGIKIQDTTIDLAILVAIVSSQVDQPLPDASCFFGEISLTGEIRPVSRIEQRISEAEKMGFKKVYLSNYYKNKLKPYGIQMIFQPTIIGLLKTIFHK